MEQELACCLAVPGAVKGQCILGATLHHHHQLLAIRATAAAPAALLGRWPQGVDQIEALAASAAHARVGAGELVRQAGAEVEVCMQQHLVCTSHGPSRPECVKGFAGRQTSPTGRVLAHTFIVPAPL
jgi:hypothetical protein